MRDSNSRERFWRPSYCRCMNPLNAMNSIAFITWTSNEHCFYMIHDNSTKVNTYFLKIDYKAYKLYTLSLDKDSLMIKQ